MKMALDRNSAVSERLEGGPGRAATILNRFRLPRGPFWDPHPVWILAALTPFVLLVHGYHPFADDGAIYVAGIKKLVQPDLYRPDAVFVLSHVRFSIFAHLLAGVLRRVPVQLSALLLVCHITSIFLFLLGCRRVAVRLFSEGASQWGAVLLGACCFTLPVAGTSLFVMDPYVTARSFSTPFSLFAIAATLDEAWGAGVFWLVLAGIVHPLMAGFALVFLIAVALAHRRMWRSLAVFLGFGFLGCGVIFLATRRVSLNLDYSRAALSRSYFFLSSWAWYEYLGLFFPLLLLGITAWQTRGRSTSGKLAVAATGIGSCALLTSVCFVHRSGSLVLARLQVLRSFHLIYLVGVLLAGGLLARLAQRRPRGIFSLYVLALLAMFAGQRLTYPDSNHLEWPGREPRNPWVQAFLWIRTNTPSSAIFALDANYIVGPGEDAQGFRVIAERSALADWYKDGGVASIFSAAAGPWWRDLHATRNLNTVQDSARDARLRPQGVSWMVLPARSYTEFLCPYQNPAVKVCRLEAR